MPNQQSRRRPMSTTSLWGIFGTLTVVALAMVVLVAVLLSKSCNKPQQNPDGTHTMTYRVRTVNPFHKLQSDHARLAGAYKAQKARADKAENQLKANAKKKLTDKMAADKLLIDKLKAELKRLKASLKEANDAKTAAAKAAAMKKALEAEAKIKELEAKLKRARGYAWSLRKRTKKKAGADAIAKQLKALKDGQSKLGMNLGKLRGRVKAAHPKGIKSTPTDMNPPPPPSMGAGISTGN